MSRLDRARRRDLDAPTWAEKTPNGALRPLVTKFPIEAVQQNRGWILPASALWRRNWFDIFGSGWQNVRYGMICAGIEGHAYEPGARVSPDAEGTWLEGRVNPANLEDSRRIWRLVDPGYEPIDWQIDLRSGFLWGEAIWHRDVGKRHAGWADPRVPQELGRMHHLPTLAWAYALARDGAKGAAAPELYAQAFRNQVLDFIATNPPRFGVNWVRTVDVAARAAVWVITNDLLQAAGASTHPSFIAVLKRSLVEHGQHIADHLDRSGADRVVGLAALALIGVALSWGEWSDEAHRSLPAAIEQAFGAGRALREGSSTRHRFAAEAIAVASAAAGRAEPLLAGMAEFTRALTKPSGRIVQIGDNDGQRFLKLHPVLTTVRAATARGRYANLETWTALPDGAPYLDENGLDHRGFVAMAGALLGRDDLVAWAEEPWLDAAWASAVA